MDLTFHTDQAKLNIRVAVILKSPRGYIFCESKEKYYYSVGGRIKINESSREAAYREVEEELRYQMRSITLQSVLENFFIHSTSNTLVHEYCFIYLCDEILDTVLPDFFVELTEQELFEQDIRPEIIKELIIKAQPEIIHRISK